MIKISEPWIGEKEKKLVEEVLTSGMLAQGEKVKSFEEKFAKFCGTKYAIAVNSGTAALHSSLYAAGIRAGDEVITTPFTFAATANCIVMQNAKPVFADIDETTFNINPEKIKEKISNKTKAILAVDLYGLPADYNALREIAEEKDIKIIEDACQAHGAELNGIKAGKLGDIGSFSFYATKNMTSGEGGMITTDNEKYAESCKRFRQHGQNAQYEYSDIGYNYRMNELEAAIALAQLEKLDSFTKKRIENAKFLSKELKGIEGITLPSTIENAKHVFHQYTIKTDNKKVKRNRLVAFLKENEISAGVYYPKPLHLHPHFRAMGYKKGDFPIAETVSEQVISLPVQPKLETKELEQIVLKIKEFSEK